MRHQRSASSARKAGNRGRRIHRRSPAERRRWLDRYERSGLSQKAFCARHGLAPSTLTYWKRWERAAGTEQAASFVEVPRSVGTVEGSLAADAAVLIELPGGVRLEFPQAADPKWLAALLRGLGRVGCSR